MEILVGILTIFIILLFLASLCNVNSSFSQHKWYTSKNGNLYNPTFGITICYSGDSWAIMRNGIFRQKANSLEEAKQISCQIWRREG